MIMPTNVNPHSVDFQKEKLNFHTLELMKKLSSRGIDYKRPHRHYRKTPDEILVSHDFFLELQKENFAKSKNRFFAYYYDGRKLNFRNQKFTFVDTPYSVTITNLGDNLIAFDVFQNRFLIGSAFYENEPIEDKESLKADYLCFCMLPVASIDCSRETSKAMLELLVACIDVVFYVELIGATEGKLDKFMPRGSKKKIKNYFRETGHYRPGHTTASGRYIPGHFAYWHR